MTGLCRRFLGGNPNNRSVFVICEPLGSHLEFMPRLLRMEAGHQKDQPGDWWNGALGQSDLQGRERGWKLSSIAWPMIQCFNHSCPLNETSIKILDTETSWLMNTSMYLEGTAPGYYSRVMLQYSILLFNLNSVVQHILPFFIGHGSSMFETLPDLVCVSSFGWSFIMNL